MPNHEQDYTGTTRHAWRSNHRRLEKGHIPVFSVGRAEMLHEAALLVLERSHGDVEGFTDEEMVWVDRLLNQAVSQKQHDDCLLLTHNKQLLNHYPPSSREVEAWKEQHYGESEESDFREWMLEVLFPGGKDGRGLLQIKNEPRAMWPARDSEENAHNVRGHFFATSEELATLIKIGDAFPPKGGSPSEPAHTSRSARQRSHHAREPSPEAAIARTAPDRSIYTPPLVGGGPRHPHLPLRVPSIAHHREDPDVSPITSSPSSAWKHDNVSPVSTSRSSHRCSGLHHHRLEQEEVGESSKSARPPSSHSLHRKPSNHHLHPANAHRDHRQSYMPSFEKEEKLDLHSEHRPYEAPLVHRPPMAPIHGRGRATAGNDEAAVEERIRRAEERKKRKEDEKKAEARLAEGKTRRR